MTERKQNLRLYDITVVFCVILKLVTIFITAFYITYFSTVTAVQVEDAVHVLEANPIVSYIVQMSRTGFLFTTILFPSMLFSIYMVFRYKVEPHLLQLYVFMVFFSTLSDFLNDFGAVLAMLYKNGLI